MSAYRTGRDYRRYSLELFKEFIPEELQADYGMAIDQLVSEMCKEQSCALSAFGEYKQIQNFISRHKSEQTTQEDKE